jgi:hypothetical protein
LTISDAGDVSALDHDSSSDALERAHEELTLLVSRILQCGMQQQQQMVHRGSGWHLTRVVWWVW